MSIELSKISGSYSNAIRNNYNKLTAMFTDPSVSVFAYKEAVKDACSATNLTKAKQKFLGTLNKQTNKAGIASLITNVILKADGLGTTLD